MGMAHYLVTRPDLFHTAPLAVIRWRSLATGAGVRSGVAARSSPARWRASCSRYAIVEGADRRWLELRGDFVALRPAVADGVRERRRAGQDLDARCAACRPACRRARRSTSRRAAPTWSRPASRCSTSSRERPNATRYDIAAPGVVTSAPVQREIVAALAARARRPSCATDPDHRRARAQPGRSLDRRAHPRPLPGRRLPAGAEGRDVRRAGQALTASGFRPAHHALFRNRARAKRAGRDAPAATADGRPARP